MVDRLSDRGFLSFTDDLKIIVRKGSHSPSLAELLAEIEGNQAKAATLLPELKNTVIRDQLESNAVDLIRRRICFKRTRLHFLGVSDRCSCWTCLTCCCFVRLFLIFPPKLRSSTMSHLRIQPLLAFVDYAQCWGELGSCSFVPSEHGR